VKTPAIGRWVSVDNDVPAIERQTVQQATDGKGCRLPDEMIICFIK
jgi:hypothetical protein